MIYKHTSDYLEHKFQNLPKERLIGMLIESEYEFNDLKHDLKESVIINIVLIAMVLTLIILNLITS